MKKIFKALSILAVAMLTSCSISDSATNDSPSLGWDYMEFGPSEQAVSNTIYCEFDYAEVVFTWEGLMILDPVIVSAERDGRCLFCTADYKKPLFRLSFKENPTSRFRQADVKLYSGETVVAAFTVRQTGKED